MIKKLTKRFYINLLSLVLLVSLTSAAAVKYFDVSKNLEIFTSLYKELNLYYVDETSPGDLMKTGIDAMLKSLDPYTVYYPESKIEDARFKHSGQYGGIGVFIENIEGKVVITEILAGYPAEKEGLREGDEVIIIDGKETKDLDQDQLDGLIKGNVGSDIQLAYIRKGETINTTLTREDIKITEVPYYGMINETDGYVKLTSFTKTAGMNVRSAVLKLKNEHNAQRLVLDLRNNGGGLLREAVNIVNLFVPKGELIVSTKGKIDSWNKVYEARVEPIAPDMPLIILVNERSASASEIVSGALQDLDRAVVIGKRSFGKGLVQQTKDLVYNSKMKLTIAKYYVPSGRCIQKLDYSNKKDGVVNEVEEVNAFKTRNGRTVYDGRGVEPDVKIEEEKDSELLKSLRENQIIFEFVNEYMNSHSRPDTLLDFQFLDSDYESFKAYAKVSNFEYSSLTEQKFDELKEMAKSEEYFQGAELEFQELFSKVKPTLTEDLDKFRFQVETELKSEIVRRYFFRAGDIQFGLIEDPYVLECIEVFNSNYSSILE